MELATTLAAITSAKDFASFLIGRKIDAAVTEKAIELQNSIIALQSGLLEMQAQLQVLGAKNQELQNQLAAAEDWQAEEDAHQLVTVAKGVHVMTTKSPASDSGLPVWYCANCWQKRFKSVLQQTIQDYGGTHYYCPNCDAKIYDHSDPAEV